MLHLPESRVVGSCRALLDGTAILTSAIAALRNEVPPVTAITLITALCTMPGGCDQVLAAGALDACLSRAIRTTADTLDDMKV